MGQSREKNTINVPKNRMRSPEVLRADGRKVSHQADEFQLTGLDARVARSLGGCGTTHLRADVLVRPRCAGASYGLTYTLPNSASSDANGRGAVVQCGTEPKTNKLLSARPGGKLSFRLYCNITEAPLLRRNTNW